MRLRDVRPAEAAAAGAVLHEAFTRVAVRRGFRPAWASPDDARRLAERCLAEDVGGAVAAEDGGRLVGVGFVRRRGEVATLGPLAAAHERQGIGSALLDELLARAEAWGCASVRLYQDAWNPDSFALYAGRSFAVVDVVAHVVRPAGEAPRPAAARGAEVTAVRPLDLAEVIEMDRRLTGLERGPDLEATVRYVARRRGGLAGFLGVAVGPGPAADEPLALGPALALEVSDLAALMARAVSDAGGAARARLSTAAPLAVPAVLELGFQVAELGTVMSRGLTPPARAPQVYQAAPEVL